MQTFLQSIPPSVKAVMVGLSTAVCGAVIDALSENPMGLLADPKAHLRQLGGVALVAALLYLKRSPLGSKDVDNAK